MGLPELSGFGDTANHSPVVPPRARRASEETVSLAELQCGRPAPRQEGALFKCPVMLKLWFI